MKDGDPEQSPDLDRLDVPTRRAVGGHNGGRLDTVSDDQLSADGYPVLDELPREASNDEPSPTDEAGEHTAITASDELDLDHINTELAGVERALGRLEDGTYWTDEISGEPIDPSVLDTDPTATRTNG